MVGAGGVSTRALCGSTAAAIAVLAGVLAGGAAGADGPPASEIVFTPPVVHLGEQAPAGAADPRVRVALEVVAYDDRGQPIAPSEENPLRIEASGAVRGTVRPETARIVSGSTASFEIDAGALASPLTLVAWIDQPGGTRKSLGRAQVLPRPRATCARAPDQVTLRVLCEGGGSEERCGLEAIRRGLHVRAAVGYDDPRGHLQAFGVDTGSIGTVVPVERLGPDAIGPGAAASVYYDSSGRIFAGSYYLASVAFEAADGRIARTPRMLVLGIDAASCAPGHPRCRPSDDPGLHYLGVGFARGAAASHRFVSPADNAFLRLADTGDGSISPGYVLTGRAITIGVPSTEGYRLAPLAPSSTAPGDWSPARGCYAFPALPAPNRFCGNVLLDVGIAEMFLDLPPAERPPGSAEPRRCGDRECAFVPDGTAMRVEVGDREAPAMANDFTLRREPRGPEPTFAQWIDRDAGFVNVGRRPLFRFHYMFDAACGNVGFARVD